MTTYYRRSGVTNWSDTTGWSLTSGGASAGVVPTAADDVIFDASSGNCTITGASGTPDLCRSLTCTGYTGTLTHNANAFLAIGDGSGGSLTFSAGMTYNRINLGSSTINFVSTATGNTIDVAGKAMARMQFTGSGSWSFTSGFSSGPINVSNGSLTIGGNFSFSGQSTWSGGSVDMNGYDITTGSQLNFTGSTVNAVNITLGNVPITHQAGTVTVTGDVSCNRFLVQGTGVKVLNMGSGTWYMSNNASGGLGWDVAVTATNFTLNAQTSTINLTDTGANNKQFRGGGKTYYNIKIEGASGNGTWTFNDGSSFNNIILEPYCNIRFTASTTNTIANAPTSWVGASGQLITIASTSASVNATVSVTSGTVSADYLNLTRITASGSTPFYAGVNSTDGGNNTNWVFTAPPAGTTGQIKAYVSGSFVSKPVKWWNGSSWVVKPLKFWDGANWITTPY